MLDEGNTPEMMDAPEAPPPEEKSNRTFTIVAGVLGGLVFLTLVCMAVYFLVIVPRTAAQRTAAQATIEAQNAQAAQQITLTAQAALQVSPLPLQTGTAVVKTAVTSPTPVIAQNTPLLTATNDPATLAALQTQLSAQMTSTGQAVLLATSAAGAGMPSTGFFDQIGLPTLIILALALIVVIFLARRMRKSPAK
jgi:ABC-type antimicrobial peptide transport system permease subunit